MDAQTNKYRITAYSEWETLYVETECSTDEQAIDKARRYGTLKHVEKNFPPVIFAHIICDEMAGPREVGTWEYQVRNVKKAGFIWHGGTWPERPVAGDRNAIQLWADNLANAS